MKFIDFSAPGTQQVQVLSAGLYSIQEGPLEVVCEIPEISPATTYVQVYLDIKKQ